MKNRKTLVSILILSVMFVTACMGGDTTTPSTDDITPQSQPISETAPDAVVPSEVDEYLSDVEVITYDDMNTFNQNLWNDPASGLVNTAGPVWKASELGCVEAKGALCFLSSRPLRGPS